MPDRFLAVEEARISFGEGDARVRALRGVSATFERGTLSLVMGPSGSGKTTLLSLLGCLLSPDEGTVFVDGVAVNELSASEKTVLRRKKISFVFQAFRLLHSLSAIDNVALGLEIRDGRRADQIVMARELLLQFGLGDKLNREPSGLSPGEKQRVAIARALAGNPPILLADEPTASLDAEAGRSICQILRSQVDKNGRTVVVVSHDPRWKEFADRTITLSDGQIKPQAQGQHA
ncbi:MAG: transporter related protein [Candidatus Sulfotelmatobacter sp.]|nr:transporter related protein [Candidatus Sulfotelmatobacter sp.]